MKFLQYPLYNCIMTKSYLETQGYTVLKTIHKNSYSKVYKVRHDNGDIFACKCVKYGKLTPPELTYLIGECNILLFLKDSEHIVRLHNQLIDKDTRTVFFVTDYCGMDLCDYLQEQTLSYDLIDKIMYQLAVAVETLHKNGIIHRDIKPENILIDDKLEVRLSDFGLSVIRQEKLDQLSEKLQRNINIKICQREAVGTEEYASPETILHGNMSEKSDIWAMGCVAYAAITGKMPFIGSNTYALKRTICLHKGFEFNSTNPDHKLFDIVNYMTNCIPEKRPSIGAIKQFFYHRLSHQGNG